MAKKILENWKHIEEVEEKIRAATGDPEAGFNATTFWIGGDGRHLMLRAMYRGKKGKKGQETFTKSYKDMLVRAKYCPFTGKPLYEGEADEKTERKVAHFREQLSRIIRQVELIEQGKTTNEQGKKRLDIIVDCASDIDEHCKVL